MLSTSLLSRYGCSNMSRANNTPQYYPMSRQDQGDEQSVMSVHRRANTCISRKGAHVEVNGNTMLVRNGCFPALLEWTLQFAHTFLSIFAP